MMPLARTLLPLAVMVSAGSCAVMRTDDSTTPSEPVSVVVVNQHRGDAAIYWMNLGLRVRLGTTVSGSQNRFVVRQTSGGALSDVRLVAEMIGSGQRFTTSRIAVSPGQIIDLRLQDLLVSSDYSVRPDGASGPLP